MKALTKHAAVSIGVTVKSGWAMIVVLSGQVSAPSLRDSYRIDLSDPGMPDQGRARGAPNTKPRRWQLGSYLRTAPSSARSTYNRLAAM